MVTRFIWLWLLATVLLSGCRSLPSARPANFSQFIGLDDFSGFTRSTGADGETILVSPKITTADDWDQLIVSWNADAPAGTFLTIEAQAIWPDHASKFFMLGRWTPDNLLFPRTSVHGQADADGTVSTDTLSLIRATRSVQIRVTIGGTNSSLPSLKFLGLAFCQSTAPRQKRPPNHTAWGIVLPTPERSQHGYPGARGWCSPTAVSMVLARWSQVLGRPELSREVPEVAAGVFDNDYSGTGNWPFNMAYAGSFTGMRGYVTRFDDVDELEDWIVAGIPVVISARWDLLRAGREDTGNGHLLVCIGFTRDGDVVCNEPATNLKTGHVRQIYLRKDVRRAWASSNNTVYLIYPVGAKLPANRYGHW
jgi:hypothetical protein